MLELQLWNAACIEYRVHGVTAGSAHVTTGMCSVKCQQPPWYAKIHVREEAQNPPAPKISFLLGFRPLYFGNIEKSKMKRVKKK